MNSLVKRMAAVGVALAALALGGGPVWAHHHHHYPKTVYIPQTVTGYQTTGYQTQPVYTRPATWTTPSGYNLSANQTYTDGTRLPITTPVPVSKTVVVPPCK
jgi:hypothetical protein